MIKINLLPEELRKIEKSRKLKINLAAFAGVGVTAAVIILVVIAGLVGRRLSGEARARARLLKLEPVASEAERIIKKNQELKKEIEELERIADQRLLWSRALNEVSDAVPEELFLVKLDYRFVKPYTMLIKGEVISQRGGERIIEFIDNLHRSKVLIKEFPEISYSIESVGKDHKTFEIRCAYIGGQLE
jgi:Tfp pilus assembly protein PilN